MGRRDDAVEVRGKKVGVAFVGRFRLRLQAHMITETSNGRQRSTNHRTISDGLACMRSYHRW
jgi:hypothetical protein